MLFGHFGKYWPPKTDAPRGVRHTGRMVRSMSLRVQLLLLQTLIVCGAVTATGIVAATLQERQLRDAYLDRMIGVAQSVAGLPAIVDAYQTDDPTLIIQPIAEVIREASGVTYVVVTDREGIRYSHPDVDRIGEPVSTDPSIPLSGKTYVGTQTGTLGESWRAKVPVFDAEGKVIGAVSVGILESTLREDLSGGLIWLVLAVCLAAILGLFGAAGVTAIVRRRTYRLEPREIASLVGSRETMLHGLSEGVVNVDTSGRVTLVNDAALSLLDLQVEDLAGKPAAEVLEPSLLAVLERGEPDGQLVLAGERILVARSTGLELDRRAVGATLLIRDHTELHALLRQMDGAQSLTDGLRAQAHEFANKLHVMSGLLELGLIDEALGFIRSAGNGGALDGVGEEAVIDDPELAALMMVKASQARELGISLEIVDSRHGRDRGASSPRLRGDIVTIVGNLVDNALEACDTGDSIRVDLRIDGADLIITVDDDGPGVPPLDLNRIFVEGVSSKTAATASGVIHRVHRRGIGLALVRRIVDRHGGAVTASDSDSGGARFTVRAPIHAPSKEGTR